MKFLTAFFALALTVSAAPAVERRQEKMTPSDVLTKITVQLGDMSKAITAFQTSAKSIDSNNAVTDKVSEKALKAVSILDQASAVLKVMNDGAATITSGQTMGLVEAIAILGPLTSLNNAVGAVTTALTKRDTIAAFQSAALIPVVRGQLETFSIESKKLVEVMVTKLPADIPASLAPTFYGPITEKLEQVLNQYKNLDV